ncbi:MAG: hypothetical protein ACLGG6_04160 [Gammaproteobacteria bacterium]
MDAVELLKRRDDLPLQAKRHHLAWLSTHGEKQHWVAQKQGDGVEPYDGVMVNMRGRPDAIRHH